MKTIDTYLCPGCAEMIQAPWLKVDLISYSTEARQECPWCEREKTGLKYRLTLSMKRNNKI